MLHVSRRVTFAAVSLCLLASFLRAEPLPTDPSLVSGELENGLRYIVRKSSNPAGRASIWIHIHSGSLNETDRQRGLAHYLEHMAFNGSENFPPGTVVPFFQSLGMTFGRDQNAFTNFEQTTYQLTLPRVDDEALGKGLMFFSDVLHKLSLSPGEIDAERQIIQEERRRRLGGRQRTSDYILEHMVPGSIFGQRNTIGTEGTIDSVQKPDFEDYYGKWYAASNATVMMVADVETDKMVSMIKDKFGNAPKREKPAPQDVGIKAYEKSFAIVATDPELRGEQIQIVRIEPGRPAVTTVEQYRDELVMNLGRSAMNRRLSDKVARGGTSYSSGNVTLGNDAQVLFSAEVTARAETGKWKDALNEIAMELQRGRAFGFSQHEIDDVKKELISSAEWAVETEPSATSAAIISRLNGSVTSGEPTMSAPQRLELLKKLLPAITLEEVSKRFAREFEPTTVAFIATLPSSGSVPSESELLDLGLKALAVKPTPEKERERATQLLAELPAGGKVVESADHAATGVTSAWLNNGVRVHHKFMDQEKNSVSVSISLIGGELLETAETRGITSAAQIALRTAATSKLSSTDIRELMTGKKVNVGGGGFGRGGGGRRGGGGGGGGGDAVSLSINGAPEDLETGFQLAYLLLTDPKIEATAFLQYQSRSREMMQEMLNNPASLGARIAGAAPYPDDEPRTKPLGVEQIEKLQLDASQAYLKKLIAESPIEVTICGDISKEKAMELTAKYLGSLPQRARVSSETYANLRKLKRPQGPRVIEKTVDTPTAQAFVASGFYGPDQNNRADVRAMTMASRILSTRMTKQVREDAQLVYSIGSSLRAGSTYPGFGVFSAAAPTEPSKAKPLAEKLASMYEEFAKTGPTEEEMVVVKKQFANNYAQDLKEPRYWSGRLNLLTYRGADLDEILEDPEAYQSLSAAQIKDTFAKYFSKENSIVVIVRPQNTATSDASK